MSHNYEKAIEELNAINAPVYNRQEYGAFFILGAELRDGNDSYFADYYQEEIKEHWHPEDINKPLLQRRIINAHGIRQDVINILDKYNLYAEWINPGMCGIYSK